MELHRIDSIDSDNDDEYYDDDNDSDHDMNEYTNHSSVSSILLEQAGLEMEPILPSITTTTHTNANTNSGNSNSSSRIQIRTTSGTLLYARNNNNTSQSSMNASINSISHSNNSPQRGRSYSFSSSQSSFFQPQQQQPLITSISSTASTSPTTTTAPYNIYRNMKYCESRTKSILYNTYTTINNNHYRFVQRSRSGIGTGTGIVRIGPRMKIIFISMILMILFSIVNDYYDTTMWNDSTTIDNNIIKKDKEYNTFSSRSSHPPTISPTIITTREITDPPTIYNNNNNIDNDKDNNNDDDNSNHNNNDNNKINDMINHLTPNDSLKTSPTAIKKPKKSFISDNIHPIDTSSYYLSVYDAYNQTQYINVKTGNSYVTWLEYDTKNIKLPEQKKLKIGTGSVFVKQWCDLTGTTWYPNSYTKPTTGSTKQIGKVVTSSKSIQSSSLSSWQLRAPYFLLPGAAYSGTVYISSLLHNHPQIIPARTKELQFFHDRPFHKYINNKNGKTYVKAARNRMHARDYNQQLLQQNTSYISFDATPGYLYYSTILPRRILCVEPWIKLVLLLRNPIDRIIEQYYAHYNSLGFIQPIEIYIQEELNIMKQVGLLNYTFDKDFFGSSKEDIAWYDYQSLSTTGGLLGRSMYVIQIRHWIDALRLAGRLPYESILIIQSEQFVYQPQIEYNRLLQFLNLSPYTLSSSIVSKIPFTLTHQTRTISNETRQLLEDFFRPYNKQLKRLLYKYNISTSTTLLP